MFMFKSLLNSIPKNRLEIVNDLEIPNVVLRPCTWKEPEDHISVESDSNADSSKEERGTLSTDSDLALSRAMTDSEIDYDWYKTLKKSRFTDTWEELKTTMANFPSDYLTSLYSYQDLYPADETLTRSYARERQRRYNEELRRRLEKLYDEECRVFDPDDPALQDLEDAIKDLKIKALDWDTKSS